MPKCRICKADYEPFISFGKMPIANGFLTADQFAEEYFFEMQTGHCNNCNMVQLIEQPDREKMFHHIVNPKTGLSPAVNTSVSVVAATAMDADALSTAVFVMNPSKGKQFIDSLSGRECLIIARGNRKIKSTGWKSRVL